MHDETRLAAQKSSNVTEKSAISNFSESGEDGKSSMIVPVWVSHKGNPSTEKLVYALLNSQSDTTFLLEETREALGIDGKNVRLLLSTMAGVNHEICSSKIEGLSVRGYNQKKTIDLPAAYTRDIMPANKDHIPTPEKAKQWEHLSKISDKLVPLMDIEVGLLIGYNCPLALMP